MKCPFCGSKDIRRRKPMVHSTQRGVRVAPDIRPPFRGFFCADCKRVMRRVYR